MGRITGPRRSYGHKVSRVDFWGCDEWCISWTVDRKIKGSRLRWPTTFKRLTTYDGARAFARRHGLACPGAQRAREEKP
jgi:hypothetical protein